MTQPKRGTQAQQQEPPAPTTTNDDPLAGLSNENADPALQALLESAKTLREEKEDVYERIDANRTLVRAYVRMGQGSEAQKKSVDLFYPKPKTKSTDNAPASA